jgi:protein TonB
MSKPAAFNPASYLSPKDSLLITLFVAVIIHIAIILGLNFSSPQPEKTNKAIDITLINTPATKAPETAQFLAENNQIGAGEKISKPEPPKQRPPSATPRPAVKLTQKSPPQENKPKATQKILTQRTAEKKVVTAPKPEPVKPAETPVEKTTEPQKQQPHLNAETLHQQLTELGTEIRQLQASADDNNNVKFISEVSAHKYVAAQYMKDWESKVERVGNLNYPEAATRKNFSGALTMDVTINADGSIHAIVITRSSGNPALDEAAKKIVRLSAPFAPLPLDLLKEPGLKILGITRVWKFSDESGMTSR